MNNHRKPYTEEENDWLKILFGQKKSDEEIALIMGRTQRSVDNQRRKLGLLRQDACALMKKRCKHWTRDEIEFICNYWAEKSDKWMAGKLGVNVSVYRRERGKLGFRKLKTRQAGVRKKWRFSEEEFLRRHYPTHSAEEVAAHLGGRYTAIAVRRKAKRIGLGKSYNPGRAGFGGIDLNQNYVREIDG